jgi:phosphoglycolate phosphatase-like HAD superfamily hydrolase
MTAVLWDLDDTLLDTLPGRMKALSHAYETCLGEKTDPEALWRSHRGGTIEDLGRRLLGESGYAQFVDTYRGFYFALDQRIQPFPGVTAALDAFQHADVQKNSPSPQRHSLTCLEHCSTSKRDRLLPQ